MTATAKPKLNRETVERMCAKAGLRPEQRLTIQGLDVFICDGFSGQPHVTFQRFGVEPDEFPQGAYCTMWWVARGEGFFEIGVPLIFDVLHDVESMEVNMRKKARINAAIKEASGFIKRRAENSRERVRYDA